MMTGSVFTSTIVDLQPSNDNYPPVAAICPSHIVKTTWQLPQIVWAFISESKGITIGKQERVMLKRPTMYKKKNILSFLHTRLRKYSMVPHTLFLSLKNDRHFFGHCRTYMTHKWHSELHTLNFLNNLRCWVSSPRWNLHQWCAPKYVTPIPRTMQRHHLAFGIVA